MSVDTAHSQNTTDWHLATVVVERLQLNDCHELLLTFLVDPARFGHRSRRGTFKAIMERLKTDPVPLGASHIPSHIRPRRCGGLCFKRPCASRRDTPHERARARDEHHRPAMPTAHSLRGRVGTHGRLRGGFFFRVVGASSSLVRCVGCSYTPRNAATHRNSGTRNGDLIKYDPKSS